MRNLKRALSLTLASVMLLGMMVMGSSALSFNDADDISNVTAATVLEELEVMQGDGRGNFMPEQPVTRAQMAILVCRILYGDKLNVKQFEGVTQYTDVGTNDYYTGYINLATQLGIIGGYGDGRFGPDDTVTTAQAALMLSRALGYFKANELEGQDWALASVAQASKIEMFGNLKLGTNELLSRDNVAEMVFNTMTKAVPVQYSERWGVYYTDSQSLMQGVNFRYSDTLAYQNFDLVYNENKTDDFNRPSTEWGIGTIRGALDDKGNIVNANIKTSIIKAMDEADLTYTKEVKVGDIYKDLGLGDTVAAGDVRVFIDGAEITAIGGKDKVNAIRKGDDTNKYGGNGVLTQVFYFPGARTNERDKIIITEVNTYTGEVTRSVAASGTRDAYVVVSTESENRPVNDGSLNFETDASIANDTRVLYTYSFATEGIVDLAVAESVSGAVDKTENTDTDNSDRKAITLDGQRYASSAKNAGETIGNVTVKAEYTIYLDFYGYMIYVEENDVAINNYALLINTASTSTFIGDRARLLFSDGTIKNVDTDKNYNSGNDKIDNYTIVTTRVDDDNVYTLKAVDSAKSFSNKGAALDGSNGALASTDYTQGSRLFSMENNKAGITVSDAAKSYSNVAAAATYHANSATAFVVADPGVDGTGSDFTAYTGIKNAPTLKAISGGSQKNNGVAAFWYCKNNTMTTVMFIFPGAGVDVEDGTSNLVYISKESHSNLISDRKIGEYYEYDVVIGDSIVTDQKVDGTVKVNGVNNYSDSIYTGMNTSTTANTKDNLTGLYKSANIDKDGVITNLKPYTTAYNPSADTEQILRGTGIDKNSKEYTFILGADKKVITAANDVQVWYVDKDGDISKSSYSSVGTDDNDTFWAVVKDYMVQVLVVEEVAEAPDAEYDLPGVAGVQWKVGNKGFGDEGESAVAKAGNIIQIKVDPSLKPTLTPAQTLTDRGNGVYEFTMPSASITDVKLKAPTPPALPMDTLVYPAGYTVYVDKDSGTQLAALNTAVLALERAGYSPDAPVLNASYNGSSDHKLGTVKVGNTTWEIVDMSEAGAGTLSGAVIPAPSVDYSKPEEDVILKADNVVDVSSNPAAAGSTMAGVDTSKVPAGTKIAVGHFNVKNTGSTGFVWVVQRNNALKTCAPNANGVNADCTEKAKGYALAAGDTLTFEYMILDDGADIVFEVWTEQDAAGTTKGADATLAYTKTIKTAGVNFAG